MSSSAGAFTERQRAELREAMACSQLEAAAESRRLAAGLPKAAPIIPVVVERLVTRTRVSHLVLVPPVPPVLTPRVAPGEITLVRDDLTVEQRRRFDRLLMTVDLDATIDVVTHLALIARRKPTNA